MEQIVKFKSKFRKSCQIIYIFITFLADFFEVGMETGLLLIVSSDVSFSTTLLLPATTLSIPGCSTGG